MDKKSGRNKLELIREEKGIVVTDAIIAILIVMLFTGLITSLISKIMIEKMKIKMNSQQMTFVTQIFEHIEKMEYNEVTEENVINYINSIEPTKISAGTSLDNLTTANKIKVKVEKYETTEENSGFDLVKIVTLTIQNELDNKPYTTEISRIKKATMQDVKNELDT